MTTPSLLSLLGTELRRIRHRRVTIVTAGLLAALLALAGFRTFLASSNAAPDLAAAEAEAAFHMEECRTIVTADGGSLSDADLAAMCFVDPQWLIVDEAFHLQSLLAGNGTVAWADVREQALSRQSWEVDSAGTIRESPADGFGGEMVSFAVLVAFVAAALGATYVGADWRSGVIESHAIWVPDRRRLLGAKLAAVGVSAVALSVVTSVGLLAVLAPSAIWRGDAAGTGGDFWVDVVATGSRAAVATAAFAVLAAAISMVARSTAAGIVGLFGWSIVMAIFADQVGGWTAYLSPFANVQAFIAQGDVAVLETVRLAGGGSESFYAASHGWFAAGLVAATIAVGAIGLSGTTFARRDIS